MLLSMVFLSTLSCKSAQAQDVKFTELKFFSTQGEFDWDKVVYGTQFDKAKLHEMQVLVEFENPTAKPFSLEVKGYRDGKLYKTEVFKDLKESGGFNSGMGGDAGTPGTVEAGVYKAEVWYNGKVVKTAQATVTGTARVWHLTVESRDDIGETAAEFKADLKSAFEAMGDVVVGEASDKSTDLTFYLGKDDADDDNDGKPDEQDVGDGNGDGMVNEQDLIEVHDLDQEIPEVMHDCPDKDKKTGIYIYMEKETGLAMVFVSDADWLKETKVAAKPTSRGNGFLRNISFTPVAAAARGNAGAKVAEQIVKDAAPKSSDSRMNIYVGNISFRLAEQQLRALFEQYGEVESVRIVTDQATGKAKGFAFVEMNKGGEAAIAGLNGFMFQEKELVVSEARPRSAPASTLPRIRFEETNRRS